MPRAPKRCAKPGCRQKAPCPTHRTWQKSSGQVDLPSNWKTIRKYAKGYSTKTCYVCGRSGVDGQVDHVIPRSQGGSNHSSNLAWICHRDHSLKTEREKQAGRKKKR